MPAAGSATCIVKPEPDVDARTLLPVASAMVAAAYRFERPELPQAGVTVRATVTVPAAVVVKASTSTSSGALHRREGTKASSE